MSSSRCRFAAVAVAALAATRARYGTIWGGSSTHGEDYGIAW